MKPSERIKELAIEQHKRCIDPAWNGNVPDETDYINALVNFLDEQGALKERLDWLYKAVGETQGHVKSLESGLTHTYSRDSWLTEVLDNIEPPQIHGEKPPHGDGGDPQL